MKIAVQTDDKDWVIGFAEIYSEAQLQISGWQEVEADPNFNAENIQQWKITAGHLVKSASGLSPMDELRQANVNMLLQVNTTLAANKQLQQAIVNQTLTQNAINKQLSEISQKLDSTNTTKEEK